eukprot:TRINITY_DN14356_c0_g1_i3.p1 TRINITY_DN14356_c0_g1~~TRINITY_DN14356_c0_g1_i3.p1  ORF type:complete len:2685 (-),score=593.20 TRINITY_DN14356_c0_g1_i3:98-8152(-)
MARAPSTPRGAAEPSRRLPLRRQLALPLERKRLHAQVLEPSSGAPESGRERQHVRRGLSLPAVTFIGLCAAAALPLRCHGLVLDRLRDNTVPGGNCTRAFINRNPFASRAPGVDARAAPRGDESTDGLLTLRAVYYAPRPVGMSIGDKIDLYTSEFAHIFERDLAVMSTVLKANAVRLAPWDTDRSHKLFLDACRRHNIFVIPTFDFDYFFSDKMRARPFYERHSELWKGFTEFVTNAKKDAGKKDDLLLMWSLNYGLHLNETTEDGARSLTHDNIRRDEYFELLRTVRDVQWVQECGATGEHCPDFRFPRPLGIPLLLDSQITNDDIGWYVGFSETVWGTWPQNQESMGITEKQFDILRPQGAFDAWLLETLPPSKDSAPLQVLKDVGAANATSVPTGTGFVWRNLSTQKCCSLDDLAGQPMAGCREMGGCTYTTQKLVLAQFGFAAQAVSATSLTLRVDVGIQQNHLTAVLQGTRTGNSCAAAGVIIDEWADDWARYRQTGCRGSPFTHPATGECDELKPQSPVRREWYGLNGQYTFLWWHCLDPRFHADHPSLSNCSADGTLGPCAFRFETVARDDDLAAWKALGVGAYCARLGEERLFTYVTAGLLALALSVELARCIVGGTFARLIRCRSGRSSREAPLLQNIEIPSVPNGAALNGAGPPVSARGDAPVRTDLLATAPSARAAESGIAGAGPFGSVRVEAMASVPIPSELCGDLPYPDGCTSASLRLTSTRTAPDGRAWFSEELLRLHLTTHVEVQTQRLWAQVEAEVTHLMSAAFGQITERVAVERAMVHVHFRALEGYLAWLDSQRASLPDARQNLDAMLGKERERQGWMLFLEAVLVRVLESLSEHTLHAPELLAALYHDVRWAGANARADGTLPERPEFVLSYDAMHGGLEALRRNTNPFAGGINFDDLNDYGEGRISGYDDASRIKKTYLESQSWFVLLDLLSNFHPVFTIKLWLFYVAWITSVGTTAPTSTQQLAENPDVEARIQQELTLLRCCLLDVSILVVTELGMLMHGFKQRRGHRKAQPGSFLRRGHRKWVVRRLASFAFGLVSAACLYGFWWFGSTLCSVGVERLHLSDAVQRSCQQLGLNGTRVCAVYMVLRGLTFVLTMWGRRVPFLRGSPSGLPPLEQGGLAEQMQTGSHTTDASMVDTSSMIVVHRDSKFKSYFIQWKRFAPALVWIGVLAICFVFEVYLAVPMIAQFHFADFCEQSCGDRKFPFQASLFGMQLHIVPSECCACAFSMGMIYLLVLLTAFIDIHFVFYVANGICGYAMGERRGLRNSMSQALRHIDLSAHMCHQRVSEKEVWTAVSDGRAMECVFGSSWRMIWSRIVESLFQECVISDRDADQMVKAARTVRWRDAPRTGVSGPTGDGEHLPMGELEEDYATSSVGTSAESNPSSPGERFKSLRFRAVALRGASWRKGGRTRCISQLHVKCGPCSKPISFPVDGASTTTVKVETKKMYSELVEHLDDHLCIKTDITKFGLKRGWQLLATESMDTGGRRQSRTQEPSRGARNKLHSFPSAPALVGESDLGGFPLALVFVDPVAYSEVTITFTRPRRVHAMSFSTTQDDPRFDPVRWELDATADGTNWRRLQTQVLDYETPLARGTPAGLYFATEPWCHSSLGGPSAIDLKSLPSHVSERLGFFASSLRGMLSEKDHPVRPGVDTLLDSTIGDIPTLTQVIPVYNEQVILTEEFLRASDGRNANLAFLISLCEGDWRNFAAKQRWDPRELYEAFVSGDLRQAIRKALREGCAELSRDLDNLLLEVRLWASMRSQTLLRTVAGAVKYHEALEVLPCVREADQTNNKALGKLVQLIITHQTFGRKGGSEEADADVLRLLKLYRTYPVFLVLDFDSSKTRDHLQGLVSRFLFEKFRFSGAVKYASVLCAFNKDYVDGDPEESMLRIVEVLPRCYPLILTEEKPSVESTGTQGKAANQLGALRFSRGHFLQMMDANMGAFFGEACKVPFVLRRFQPRGSDRRKVEARIIGFREHIFTGRHGAVGEAMADAEWSFGTICQRFLAGLGARMHYGHPDFFDAFWASNRGSVSKASPIINLSEDIFAGFGVLMRGEKSKHVDCLEWEKGREVSFNKASQFFTKVSSGNVGVMRSRDLKLITENLNVFGSFSFYFASVGFYVCQLMVDLSMKVYVYVFILLTLSSKGLDDIGQLGSMLAVEWVVSFGIFAMFPRLMELTLEYGMMEGLVRFVPSIPASFLLFAFMNKTSASAVDRSIQSGVAKYISTGRPNANSHYSWRECYLLYRESHYSAAVVIFVLLIFYRALAEDFAQAALPMAVLTATALCWIVGPIVFCPQPTWSSIRDDLSEFWNFCIGTGAQEDRPFASGGVANLEEHLAVDADNARANLYDVWLKGRLAHKRDPPFARILELTARIVRLALVMSVVYALMVNQMRIAFLLFTINYFLLVLWRLMRRSSIILMLTFCFWLVVFLALPGSQAVGDTGSLLVAFLLLFDTIGCIECIILLTAWFVLRPDISCTSLPEECEEEKRRKTSAIRRMQVYDSLVEYMYLHSMTYQWHLYVAIGILLVDLLMQSALVLLEMCGGLHSGWLLNGRLRTRCCTAAGDEPFFPSGGAGRGSPAPERARAASRLQDLAQAARGNTLMAPRLSGKDSALGASKQRADSRSKFYIGTPTPEAETEEPVSQVSLLGNNFEPKFSSKGQVS